MTSSNPDGGPYFTSDGRCYYYISGKPVYSTSRRAPSASSSTRVIPHSVHSDFESHKWATSHASYPPTRDASDLRARMTQGHPRIDYSSGRRDGSAPPGFSRLTDPYRDSVDSSKSRYGPPLNSEFTQRSYEYHDLDKSAFSARDNYQYHRATASISKKAARQQPDIYIGNPPETRAWHDQAAKYVDIGSDLFTSAAKARTEMGLDYIGYDERHSARGHKKRIAILEREARGFKNKPNSRK